MYSLILVSSVNLPTNTAENSEEICEFNSEGVYTANSHVCCLCTVPFCYKPTNANVAINHFFEIFLNMRVTLGIG